MSAVVTLNEAEQVVANLSESDKAQLLRWLEKEVKNGFAGIEKRKCNGRRSLYPANANSRLVARTSASARRERSRSAPKLSATDRQ